MKKRENLATTIYKLVIYILFGGYFFKMERYYPRSIDEGEFIHKFKNELGLNLGDYDEESKMYSLRVDGIVNSSVQDPILIQFKDGNFITTFGGVDISVLLSQFTALALFFQGENLFLEINGLIFFLISIHIRIEYVSKIQRKIGMIENAFNKTVKHFEE